MPLDLSSLKPFDAGQFIQAGEAGQKQRTLADLGQYAARGDYRGAASAAFAGGQTDIGAALAKMSVEQHNQLIQDAASGAYAADTPEKWAQFASSFQQTHPDFEVPPFQARDVLINQALSVADQMQNHLAERRQALDERTAGVPAGFQRASGGGVQYIPGGPADPDYQAQLVGAKTTGAFGNLLDVGYGGQAGGAPTNDLVATEGTDTLPGASAPLPSGFSQTPPANDGTMGAMPSPNGDESYLSQFPAPLQNMIRKIANYEIDPAKSFSIRGNQRATAVMLASMYDPTYDQSQFGARSAMRKAATSGQIGNNIQALNLSLQHLGGLEDEISGLHNTQFTPWNAGKNALRGMTGDPAITNFRQNAMAVATEVAKVFRGAGAMSEREIHDWMGNFDINASPEQMQGAIDKARELLAARLDTIGSQYRMAMGKPIDFSVLTPHTIETLTPEARQILGLDQSPAAGMTDGNGVGGWSIEPVE